jgi:hypothetical protein
MGEGEGAGAVFDSAGEGVALAAPVVPRFLA